MVLDLEDAVAIAEKPATRETVVTALKVGRPCRGYVRVNSFDTDFCVADLQAVIGPWLDGIVLPKVEDPAQLIAVDWLMREGERRAKLAEGSVDLVPIIETGVGVNKAEAICGAVSRVQRIAFGAGDYHLDMNLVWDADEAALAHARGALATASRVAGIEPPIDTVVLQIRDIERFIQSARHGLTMGFQGKLCIHPDQVAPANEVFSPAADDVEHARRVIAAFDEAEAAGSASIQLDGYFIDYPIVERARRIVAVAESLKS